MKGNKSVTYVVFILLLTLENSKAGLYYSLSYSYFDEIAQAYCASKSTGWVFALRRNCAKAPTCNDMCARAKTSILRYISHQRTSVSCFDAFHIKKYHAFLRANPHNDQPDSGRVNLGTYGYGSGGCTWRANHCGPNYCCCKAYGMIILNKT